VILQHSTIGDTAISREAGEVPDEIDISLDPPEEATALPTDSIVDNQPKTSPLEISTAEQNPDENSDVRVQNSRPVERSGRSPLSELLVYRSSTNKQKSAAKSYTTRILTSAQSIAIFEEKKRKKLEDEEEKKRKKEERTMKGAAKEEEKKRKALEREAKKVEAQQKRKDQSIQKWPSKSSTKNCSKR